MNVTCTDALNPWDVGDLAGQQRTPELAARLDEYRTNRLTRTPDGESFAEFLERWSTALKRAEDYVRQYLQRTLVLVTDAENIDAGAELFGASDPAQYDLGLVNKMEFGAVGKRGSICCTVL